MDVTWKPRNRLVGSAETLTCCGSIIKGDFNPLGLLPYLSPHAYRTPAHVLCFRGVHI